MEGQVNKLVEKLLLKVSHNFYPLLFVSTVDG